MKVFLQSSVDMAYLTHRGHWTWDRSNAASYPSTVRARNRCRNAGLEYMRLVVSYDDGTPPYDICIAVD